MPAPPSHWQGTQLSWLKGKCNGGKMKWIFRYQYFAWGYLLLLLWLLYYYYSFVKLLKWVLCKTNGKKLIVAYSGALRYEWLDLLAFWDMRCCSDNFLALTCERRLQVRVLSSGNELYLNHLIISCPEAMHWTQTVQQNTYIVRQNNFAHSHTVFILCEEWRIVMPLMSW